MKTQIKFWKLTTDEKTGEENPKDMMVDCILDNSTGTTVACVRNSYDATALMDEMTVKILDEIEWEKRLNEVS